MMANEFYKISWKYILEMTQQENKHMVDADIKIDKY